MSAHRWLKFRQIGSRSLFLGGGIAALLLGLRFFWGWEASARLAAAKHQFAATVGMPFGTPESAATAGEARPIPDNQNAAVMFTKAVQSVHMEAYQTFGRGEGRMMPFGRSHWSFMETARWRPLIGANRQAVELLDQAAALPRIRWRAVPLESWEAPVVGPGFGGGAGFGGFTGNLQLRSLLRAGAEMAHQDHHDLEAIAYLNRMLAAARIMDSNPDLEGQIAAAGMRSEAAQTLERWDLQPTGEQRAALQGLLQALLGGDGERSTAIARSFIDETETYASTATTDLPRLQGWWLRPLSVDAFARRLSLQLELLPVVRARNWQAAAAVHLPRPADHTNLNAVVMALSEPRLEVVEAMRIHFRALADTRAVGALLAASLYRADTGAYPARLEQLVPKYLAEVPADPFDAANKPLHYRLDGTGAGAAPTIWSVGENGVDDGGKFPASTFGGPGFGFGRRYGQPDIIYGAAWRAAIAAATMP